MSPSTLRTRLEAATAAIAELTRRGVSARGVTVMPSATVILIDQPPASSWIRGALRARVDGRRQFAAPFQGFQLRWEVANANTPRA
jgi:hypothetical protein